MQTSNDEVEAGDSAQWAEGEPTPLASAYPCLSMDHSRPSPTRSAHTPFHIEPLADGNQERGLQETRRFGELRRACAGTLLHRLPNRAQRCMWSTRSLSALSAPVKRSKGKKGVLLTGRAMWSCGQPQGFARARATSTEADVEWRCALKRSSGDPCPLCCQQIIPPPTALGLLPRW